MDTRMAMSKRNKYRKVEVKWIDSRGFNLDIWRYKDEIKKLDAGIMHTAGYLIRNKKKYITIASTVFPDEKSFGGIIVIPSRAILRIR